MRIVTFGLILSSGFVLAACATVNAADPAANKALVESCMQETGAPGVYSSRLDLPVPRVWEVAKLGGTKQGAEQINACVARKASETGSFSVRQPDSKTTVETETVKHPSADSQRKAIFACKDKMGIGGQTSLNTSWQSNTLFGGQTVVRINPHDQVSAEDAARINACVDRSLGLSAAATAPVSTKADARKRLIERPNRSNLGCPKRAPVIYGGTSYCIGTRV